MGTKSKGRIVWTKGLTKKIKMANRKKSKLNKDCMAMEGVEIFRLNMMKQK